MRYILLTLLLFSGCSQNPALAGQIDVHKAILAIIGEAEAEGPRGMLAVADAIRNRGSLKGVYGLHSRRVRLHLYSQHTLELATRAWKASLKQDITKGAQGWGSASDMHYFRTTSWWHNCTITVHIGNQWFYRSGI